MADKYQKTQLENIVLGMLSASIFFLVLFQILDFGLERYKIFITTAFMAIIGTLIAALISNVGTRRQIQANYDLEEKRRDAKLIAEKAVLSIALSKICKICEANMRMHNPTYHTDDAVYEEIDTPTINTLKACIEFADGHSQKHLANLIKTYQVLLSRGRGVKIRYLKRFTPLEESTYEDFQVNIVVMDWAMLYALSAQALAYSREEVEAIPQVSLGEDIKIVFQFAEIFLNFNSNLQDLFDQKLKEDSFKIF